MTRIFNTVLFAILLVALTACATLQSNFQKPSVSIVSISPTTNTGLEQSFELGLRITNHNAAALNLIGMNYALELEGVKIIKGAASNIPSIAAYSDEVVNVTVTFGIIEGLKLANRLLNKSNTELSYKLSANLDTGLPIIGMLPVVDSGVLDLADL